MLKRALIMALVIGSVVFAGQRGAPKKLPVFSWTGPVTIIQTKDGVSFMDTSTREPNEYAVTIPLHYQTENDDFYYAGTATLRYLPRRNTLVVLDAKEQPLEVFSVLFWEVLEVFEFLEAPRLPPPPMPKVMHDPSWRQFCDSSCTVDCLAPDYEGNKRTATACCRHVWHDDGRVTMFNAKCYGDTCIAYCSRIVSSSPE